MKRESAETPTGRTQATITARDLQAGQLEIIESDGVYMSTTALLTLAKTRLIPLIDPPRFDERRLCKHAIDGAAPSEVLACPCLQSDLSRNAYGLHASGGLWCSLNGSELRSPCVFLEPQDAPVWVEIRTYAERWGVSGG